MRAESARPGLRSPFMALLILLGPLCLHFDNVSALSMLQDTVIRKVDKPLHAGTATLTPELSIGLIEGAEEYLFGDVSELAVGPDGSIYVFDRQVPALRKYDARGKFVRTFGRKGQGPGEYLSGGGLVVLPDGRVLLWDTGTWRINIYSPAGESLVSMPTPSGMGGNSSLVTSRSLVVDSTGQIYVRRQLLDRQKPGNARSVWLRMKTNGAADTIAVPDLGVTTPTVSARSTNSSSSSNVPFAPRAITSFSPPGYFVTAFPSRYAFELRPVGSAHQIVSIRRSVEARRVSAEERSAARSRIEAQMRVTDPGWNWNGPEIPRTKPFFENIAIGADGRIWVAVIPEVAARRGSVGIGGGVISPRAPAGTKPLPPAPALYDVYEANGTFLGEVAVPPRVNLAFRRGDYVWGTAYDEDDVTTVRRYRIAWR